MVTLDLIELADLARPEQLVDEIVRQNPELPIPVPIEELATQAGIVKIEAFASTGFAGALVANETKSQGAIFYSSNDPRSRQRFTIGHELGHFLLPWHKQSSFECKAADMTFGANAAWEIEANRFSAELLMPRRFVMQRLKQHREVELLHVRKLEREFETSFQMSARRYVELNEYPCAVVFSKDNVVKYWVKSEYFELTLGVRNGQSLPKESSSRDVDGDIDDWDEIDAYWWLAERRGVDQPESIYEQTLRQENGFKVTLLTYDE